MPNVLFPAATKQVSLIHYLLLLSLILPFYKANAQTYYKVDDLPNPQVSNRTNVCDPDGVLSDDAKNSLNSLAASMKQSTGAQLAIAVVRDFDQKQDEFSFATSLFRKWGVGGAHSDNGLLLFVAINRKEYRFITGYGLEGPLPDVILADVGRHYLVPAFKQAAYGDGIIKAISVIDTYLKLPNNQRDMQALLAKDNEQDIVTPWYVPVGFMALMVLIYWLLLKHIKKQVPSLPKKRKDTEGYDNRIAKIVVGIMIGCFVLAFIIAFTVTFDFVKHISLTGFAYVLYGVLVLAFSLRYLYALSTIRKSHTDDINYNQAAYQFQKSVWWYVLFSPMVLLWVIIEAIRRSKSKKRLAPQVDEKGNQLTRVDRDQNPSGAPYLTAGQKKEEQEGSYSYDIWIGSTAGDFKVIANEGRHFGNFDVCPKCHFKTLAHPVIETIVASTYKSEGKGKKVAHCSFCQYEQLIEMVTLPKRTESSSSSDSSSSSGGSSSSSSSDSGSYGGGSTGGGGAGGSW